MKLRVLPVLGAAVAIAGCGSHSAQPTATPPATKSPSTVAVRPTKGPATVTDPVKTPTPASTRTNKPVHTTGNDFAQASAYLHARKYSAAEAAFKVAIMKKQNLAAAEDGLGTAALALQDYRTAYKAFKAAVALQPKNPAYVYYAADSGLYASDFHGSVSYATRYITLQPRDARGYHLRFLVYGRLLDHKKQVKDARAVVRLQPRDPNSFNDLGIALYNDNQFAASVQAFSQAIKLAPKYDAYYINRALADAQNKQPKMVIADLETARRLAKDPLTRHQIDEAIKNYEHPQRQHK